MSVFEAGLRSGEEGLDEFGLTELRQESESIASDKFIRVLQVVP